MAGDVLAEQVVDRAEGPLHHGLGLWAPRRGGLHAHPERLAGGDEALREVDLAAVDDDRLGHDHRAGGRAFQPFVQ
ncbi:hypothetical protein [Streptomyces roseochromogenus]|uniref:Uncharacterized protein n=1 Tax=Streptomyces roseochromogenus subsp. oscitans DS 12.976 TaxID=1352936 RepID=V6JFH4_STRRC|nr:hypothetical protein M878_44865 [Streptomyces roseochromogenus subsp. oscitans DS 12.976]